MRHEVLYRPSYSLLVLELQSGEEVVAETGAMVSMSGGVEGVDAVLIGPGDLGLSLGVPGGWQDPRVQAEVDRIHAATRAAGKAAIMVALDHEDARRLREQGYQGLMVVTTSLIATAAREFLQAMRGER